MEADFKELNNLEESKITATASAKISAGLYEILLTVENGSDALAFAINPRILMEKSGDLVTPVFWDDNYFTLLPKEKKTLRVSFNEASLGKEKPVMVVDGWNVKPFEVELNK